MITDDMLFLHIVQQSEFKKGATREQLLFPDAEEVEEIADDFGYEAILEREHDDELAEVLGPELFAALEKQVLAAGGASKQLITFIDSLGFHLLDLVVILETQFSVSSEQFTPDVLKRLDKQFPRFPYVDDDKTVLDMTVAEVSKTLQEATNGAVHILRT